MTAVPRCPLEVARPCTLCQLDVTGPADCPLVYLVRHDPDLEAAWHDVRASAAREHRSLGARAS